jgi:WD40 repeat protein
MAAVDGELIRTYKGHGDSVHCLQVVDDVLYSGSIDKTVRAWSASSGELIRTYKGHGD